MLCGLRVEVVGAQTANRDANAVSVAADSREKASMCGVLDGGEGGVRLEEVGDDLRTLHVQLVATQTVNSGQNGVSAGADSRIRACGGVLELLEGCILLEAL